MEETWEDTANAIEQSMDKKEEVPEEVPECMEEKAETEKIEEPKQSEEAENEEEKRSEKAQDEEKENEKQSEKAQDEEQENKKQSEKAEDEEQENEKQSEKAQYEEEAMSWPGKVQILDSTGLTWQFWDNKWWLGFPVQVDDQMPDDEVGDDWSIHSDVASTVYPPDWPSDWEGELAALEAEKQYPNCAKNPALKEKIMQHKEESKKRRAEKEAEKQKSKIQKVETKGEKKEKLEEADISWTPLTSKGFIDFLENCTGHHAEVERREPLPELQSKNNSKNCERTAPVKWGPCTKQGVASFQRVFALQAAPEKPENMELPDLLAYSIKIKDFSEIPSNTPTFVVDTIKNIVELYDTWGVADPKKLDYWLRIRLGVTKHVVVVV